MKDFGKNSLMVCFFAILLTYGSAFGITNLIYDPSFENPSSGYWSEYSSNGWDIINQRSYLGVPPRTGDYAAWLGGDYSEDSRIWQTLIIPPNVILAPLNPDFVKYYQELEKRWAHAQIAESYRLGLIPSPIDRSHLIGQKAFKPEQLVGLPTSYDLRVLGKVTPVRNQGDCGSCWSFATYGSLESSLLTSETWDFSENNLKNTHGFDWGHCETGNADISTAYLARWSGPISEADDPYSDVSGTSPPGLIPRKHVQEVLIIPDRASSSDNDNLKQAVMTYGAVYTTFYWNSSYFNFSYHAYYYDGSNYNNHAVAIVGWDDYFDRDKFSTAPPGDGAFIIKNSWGTGWGENGYGYISYYDSSIGKSNHVFNNGESTSNYLGIYQYDSLGHTNSSGYGSNTAWFANIFNIAASESLEAVSFYTTSLNSSYEIYLYTGVTSGPTSGSLAGSKTGTIASVGYHTISLDSPIPLVSGEKFSVVVRLTTPGYNFPIPMERPYSGYSSQATANPGESYISSNGTSWSDITSYYPNTNVCLKAFTKFEGGGIVDFNSDGKTDIAVYHFSSGLWFIKPSSGAADYYMGYGGTGYDPVPGDYDGDGKTDVAVYHSASGLWFIKPSSGAADYYVGYGGSGYVPVPGDYDGDGKTDVAVYHSASGLWFVKPSSSGVDYYVGYGGTDYRPVPGDYDGDGKTDIAVYHVPSGLWFIKKSSDGSTQYVAYGGTDYTPVNLDYLHGYVY